MLGLPYADDDDMLSCVDACRFGLAVTRWSRTAYSYSTPGPVSAWMGDRLWTGKPARRGTRHPGLLGRRNEYPAKAWGKQTVSVVLQC